MLKNIGGVFGRNPVFNNVRVLGTLIANVTGTVTEALGLRSSTSTGVLKIAGPGAGTTRTATVPNADFTVARADAAQSLTGKQTVTVADTAASTFADIIELRHRVSSGSPSDGIASAVVFLSQDVDGNNHTNARIYSELIGFPYSRRGTIVFATSAAEQFTPVPRVKINSDGGVNFVPTSTPPWTPSAGDVYYDSGTNKLRCYNGTTWNDLF